MYRTELLRVKRASLGLKLYEVADLMGISRGEYSKIESGQKRGSVRCWLRIRDFYQLTAEDVVKCLEDFIY